MDMHSREQYLEALREDYRRASKKQKTKLLNEARRRTRLNRKVLIGKLAHPAPVKQPTRRRSRRRVYGAELKAPLDGCPARITASPGALMKLQYCTVA